MTHICVWTLYLLHPTLSIKSQLEGLVQHFQGQGHQQDGCQQDGQYQLVHEDDDVDDSRYQLVLKIIMSWSIGINWLLKMMRNFLGRTFGLCNLFDKHG